MKSRYFTASRARGLIDAGADLNDVCHTIFVGTYSIPTPDRYRKPLTYIPIKKKNEWLVVTVKVLHYVSRRRREGFYQVPTPTGTVIGSRFMSICYISTLRFLLGFCLLCMSSVWGLLYCCLKTGRRCLCAKSKVYVARSAALNEEKKPRGKRSPSLGYTRCRKTRLMNPRLTDPW